MDGTGIHVRPANKCTPALKSEFETLFNSGDFSLAYTKALVGLRQSHVRSICWRMFLGVLSKDAPIATWKDTVDKQRQEYHEMREKWIIDPHKHKDLDPNFNNPLSTDTNSPWSKFFETAQLEEEIRKDLERLYPEHDFFADKEILERMDRILTLWATLHPDVSYRQGMHELLAPIVLAVDRDKIDRGTKRDDDHLLCHMMDMDYVEHDAFVLFSHLMLKMKDAFTVHKQPKPAPGTPADPSKLSPVLRMCHRIHNVLLKKKDQELYLHLHRLEIEPQLYALKWVRLLLGREFHLEDVMNLWDAILSDGPNLALLEYICVAMLMYIREDLLQKEQTGCLQRLMRYPPVENVNLFVERALELRDPVSAPLSDPILQRGGSGTVVSAASNLAAKAASGVVSAIKGAGHWTSLPETSPSITRAAYPPTSSASKKATAKSAGLFDDDDDVPASKASSNTNDRQNLLNSKNNNNNNNGDIIAVPKSLGTKMGAALASLTAALQMTNSLSPEVQVALDQLQEIQQHLDPHKENVITSAVPPTTTPTKTSDESEAKNIHKTTIESLLAEDNDD